MLSRPGALPDFNFLIAASSSSTVKSDDMLASAVAALESEVTSREVPPAKSLSASGKHPLSVGPNQNCAFSLHPPGEFSLMVPVCSLVI